MFVVVRRRESNHIRFDPAMGGGGGGGESDMAGTVGKTGNTGHEDSGGLV